MKNMMNKTLIASLLAIACVCYASAKSPKRGVGENQFNLATQMNILKPGVSWFYTWGTAPGKGYQSQVVNTCDADFEFVPMCWSGNYDADAIRTWCAEHPETKYILGFNEPNFKAQANMTPAAAAEKWPELVALANELGLKIVAPAMNYSPDAPYTNPLTWFDEFVAIVGTDAFDYVAIHNYGGLGVMQTLAGNFHERYGKDVWVTEFCYWPNEGDANSYVAPATQIASMMETVQWLEQTEWIYRYAWFKPVGKHDSNPSPNYGLIITENGLGERSLSPQGYVYVYMSSFDKTIWYEVNEVVEARNYVDRQTFQMEKSTDPSGVTPIDITQFSAGAYVDYQFNVPTAGEYTLKVRCAGQGEPVRFDPCFIIQMVDGDNVTDLTEKTSFTLSGDNAVYEDKTFKVTLPAGHITLRIADGNQYEPSGIRFSTVCLVSDAGVEDIAVDNVDESNLPVYTLDGRQVDITTAAPGIYIRGNKKFIK